MNELVKEIEEVIDTLKLCERNKEKDLTTPQERAILKNKGEQDG